MSFEKYGLSPKVLDGLADVRLEKPTPFQEKMLPIILKGKHVLVETDTNDDLAFLIPAVQKIIEHGGVKGTQVLILTPSIERAEILDQQIWALGYHAQINSALMAMKGDKNLQEQALLSGSQVIVANPGRFIEIVQKNDFKLTNLKLIIIDEAHIMEHHNIANKVKEIFFYTDCEPQVVILSNNKNSATTELVELALKNPELIGFNDIEDDKFVPNKEPVISENIIKQAEKKLKHASVSVVLKKDIVTEEISEMANIESNAAPSLLSFQSDDTLGYIKVPPRMKISTLMAYLSQSKAKRVIVFSSSSRTADRLFKIIRKKNWGVVSIVDDLDENLFSERIERFKKYEMRIMLVGGLSIDKVDCSNMDEIINYDVPSDIEEFQTRALKVSNTTISKMITLVSKMDNEALHAISNTIPLTELPYPKESSIKQKKLPPSNNKRTGRTKKISQKKDSLHRPNYEGLTGGRIGKENGFRLTRWLKNLFN